MASIAVIGTGYVGLTTGACFAHLGHDVICADIDEEKVERLRRGEIPIVEAGLDRLVEEGLRAGNLSFVVGAAEASKDCEFHYLCVPTPQGDDGSADLSYLQTAAAQIAPVLPAECGGGEQVDGAGGFDRGRCPGAWSGTMLRWSRIRNSSVRAPLSMISRTRTGW